MISLTRTQQRITENIVAELILIGVSIVFIIPLLWMISTSLKPASQVFTFPPQFIPNPPMWSDYLQVFQFVPFLLFVRNSLIIAVGDVVGVLLSCSLVAFSLSRLQWRGRDVVLIIVLATTMIPFQVTMVPVYMVFHWLNWIDTFLPLIVPAYFGNAFFIFMLRQFFMTLPNEIDDAARIDGCSELGIFRLISLPLIKPALAAVALFAFLGSWNDLLGPVIYLNKPSLYTVMIGLQYFQGLYTSEWSQMMAAATMTTLPIIVIFFLAQRTFVEGIALTGIRG